MKNNPQAQEVTRIGMIRKSPVRYFIRPRILSDGFYSPLVRLLPLICIFRVVLVLYFSCWIGMHVQIDLSPQASEAWLCKSLCLEHPSGIGLVFLASETWELCCCALFSPRFVIKLLKIVPSSGHSLRYHCFLGLSWDFFFFFPLIRLETLAGTSSSWRIHHHSAVEFLTLIGHKAFMDRVPSVRVFRPRKVFMEEDFSVRCASRETVNKTSCCNWGSIVYSALFPFLKRPLLRFQVSCCPKTSCSFSLLQTTAIWCFHLQLQPLAERITSLLCLP